MSKVYIIRRKQMLNTPLHLAWRFFSDPANLSTITPPDLGFNITSHVPDNIHDDLVIQYRVKPLLGIPVTWETHIKDVSVYNNFTDIQAKGPYRSWVHTHRFHSYGDKTVVDDEVQYTMPYGWIGRFFHALVVKRRLNQIFEYRRRILERLFNA